MLRKAGVRSCWKRYSSALSPSQAILPQWCRDGDGANIGANRRWEGNCLLEVNVGRVGTACCTGGGGIGSGSGSSAGTVGGIGGGTNGTGSGGGIGTPLACALLALAPLLLVPGEVGDATSGAETIRIIDCRARDRLTVRADPFPVAQNGMTVRDRKLVALYDAAREGERPAHSLSDGGGDAVVQRLDGLDVLGKHQGEAFAQGW